MTLRFILKNWVRDHYHGSPTISGHVYGDLDEVYSDGRVYGFFCEGKPFQKGDVVVIGINKDIFAVLGDPARCV